MVDTDVIVKRIADEIARVDKEFIRYRLCLLIISLVVFSLLGYMLHESVTEYFNIQ